MNIGEIVKNKIIECENKIRNDFIDAYRNNKLIVVNYGYDAQKCGYSRANLDHDLLESLINDVIKNNYSYVIG